jgi:hypothetical protein
VKIASGCAMGGRRIVYSEDWKGSWRGVGGMNVTPLLLLGFQWVTVGAP